jgi:hypothetical protein
MKQVRKLFDFLIKKYPSIRSKLSQNADIVHSKAFESGIVKILRGEQLNYEEELVCERFKKDNAANEPEKKKKKSFVEESLSETPSSQHTYQDLHWIPPTSVDVERLFSTAKDLLTDKKKSTTHFEAVLFLRKNVDLWDGGKES